MEGRQVAVYGRRGVRYTPQPYTPLRSSYQAGHPVPGDLWGALCHLVQMKGLVNAGSK